MKYKRIFIIVLDSLGIGAMDDAIKYGDENSNTFKHIAKAMALQETNGCLGINVPQLEKLGIGLLEDIEGISKVESFNSLVLKMNELSVGKDTLTGHWEMMGLEVKKPFKTFTETGFSKELIDELERRCNRKILGNISASGTEIIQQYGQEHLDTGSLIVYTSADSVLQIATHTDIISLEELYKYCEIARDLTMKEEWMVGRVIARPFNGNKVDGFKRVDGRHDYAIKPFGKTVLEELKENNYEVISIGKINDIFAGVGINQSFPTNNNDEGMAKIIEIAKTDFNGLTFLNLVDFDAIYGHRRNPIGYGKAIERFDKQLKDLLEVINDDDLLMLTSDHGNDPVHQGTDHTREKVFLIMYNRLIKGKVMPEVNTFAYIGATIADNFNVKAPLIGKSLLNEIEMNDK